MRSRTTAGSRTTALLAAALATLVAPVVALGQAEDVPVSVAVLPSTTLNQRLRSGVVRVLVSGQEWNWKTPWAKQPPWTRPIDS